MGVFWRRGQSARNRTTTEVRHATAATNHPRACLGASLCLDLPGCNGEDPVEEARRGAEQAGEEMREDLRETGEQTREGLEEAGEEVREAVRE